jgi:hypothetical protein
MMRSVEMDGGKGRVSLYRRGVMRSDASSPNLAAARFTSASFCSAQDPSHSLIAPPSASYSLLDWRCSAVQQRPFTPPLSFLPWLFFATPTLPPSSPSTVPSCNANAPWDAPRMPCRSTPLPLFGVCPSIFPLHFYYYFILMLPLHGVLSGIRAVSKIISPIASSS